MKIKILRAAILLLLSNITQAQGLLVQSGVTFKTTGNVSIVLYDGSLVNNGSTDFDGSNLYFVGNTPGSVTGSSNLSINRLLINRPATTIFLGRNINVSSEVALQGGLLDLNNKTLSLSASAILSGETEINRIISPSGGEITITVPLNAPLAANPGNLGAIINSPADMGSVTIKRSHKPYSNVTGANSIMRYYDIIPQNNTGLTAFLRFNYLDAELNGLSESDLKVFKSVDNGLNWTDEGFNGRNTSLNFVDLAGISSFAKTTLSTGTTLPITLTHFKASCSGATVATEWETLTEVNADKFLIQRSTDTRQWETIATVAAKGNSINAQTYNWADIHPLTNYAFYRLQELDKDGKGSYSSVVSAGCTGTAVPAFAAYPNPVKDILKARIVSNDNTSGVSKIYSFSGQLLNAKTVALLPGFNTADLNLSAYPKGTYKLVFEIKGKEKETLKVIKQ